MILAAGKGTRMGALSDTLPKPLTAVKGQVLLDRLLSHSRTTGCDKIIVNVHHLADMIEAHLVDETACGFVRISDERAELLETGGGVQKALPFLGGDPFFVLNGDALWVDRKNSNLSRLKEHWDSTIMDVLLLLVRREEALGYEGVGDFFVSDGDGVRALKFRDDHPAAPFVFGGVQLVHPRLYEGMPEGAWSNREIFRKAAITNRLFGLEIDGSWMHVGTPEAVVDAETKLAEIGAA